MSGFVISPETRASQARASNPAHSAWVSANAGSGKTHVLSQRVIRLLLDGTDPARILCLTYTRAAAANMANRVFKTLSAWTTMPQADLEKELRAIEDGEIDEERMLRARRLFARALETPGGLKIQTIHAFCEAVLHQFPLEANVAGHFELLDPQMEAALVAEARRALVAGAAEGRPPELAEAFADVLARAGESGLEKLLGEIVGRRDELKRFIGEVAGDSVPFAPLFEGFGLRPDDAPDDILRAVWPDGIFTPALAAAFAERAGAAGKKHAQAFAEGLTAACAAGDGETCLDYLRSAFLKKDGPGWAPRASGPIFSKGVREHFPEAEAEFERMAGAVHDALDRTALLSMLQATRAALVLADWLIARYERLKAARGFLDFNDLIARTVSLLARQDAGAWVQYKLDRGIDHILLDEAQDTSPPQWQVVKGLASEFFAGLGARGDKNRTVFAVGDEKQSIYSFQGAEPAAFAESGHEFRGRVEAAERGFERVVLSQSFRSTPDVLSAVDLVFAREEVRQGLTRDKEDIRHTAVRHDAPGHVELWPALSPVEVAEPDDWTLPIDHASAPAVRLAVTIADTIAHWLASGERLEGRGRAIRAGDVMVLVRKRDSFVHALSRELKERHVPVAGADRLTLAGHIGVQDLLAIARFVLQPDDDLSLAALLKSPVFGLSEDDLFVLAHGRAKARPLIAVLDAAAEGEPRLSAVREKLRRWRDEAGYARPFEFFGRILARDGVRADMIARLGQEAGDILDEFLSFCLAAEKTGVGDLERFVALLEEGGPQIKREMDQSRGEVRIMTTHAAKGLEAAIVFLVDSGSAAFTENHLPRLVPIEPPGRAWRGKGFLWRSGADTANTRLREVADRIRRDAEQEYRRLLYVGMTRAEDRLVVCGYRGKRPPRSETWHSLVETGLRPSSDIAEIAHPTTGETILRYRVTPPGEVAPGSSQGQAPRSEAPMPAALWRPVPPAPALPRPLAPSGTALVIEDASASGPSHASPVLSGEGEPSLSLERGSVIHRLLQLLPDLPREARKAAALRYLARLGERWGEAARQEVWRAVCAVLDEPAFAALFREGSRAEVPVMGTVALGSTRRAVSGKVDRLAVAEGEVLIVDYKTNRPVPAAAGEIAPAYVAQLALYRALLEPIYPGRAVRAGLLFTDAPRLFEIAPEAMDDALARLAGA